MPSICPRRKKYDYDDDESNNCVPHGPIVAVTSPGIDGGKRDAGKKCKLLSV